MDGRPSRAEPSGETDRTDEDPVRSPARRRLTAAVSALLLAAAPVHFPGPTADAAAALGGPPEIETLGFAPLVGDFTVVGQPLDHIVIIWDEILDRSSTPAPADFTLTISGVDHQPTGVEHLYAGVASDEFGFGTDGASFMRIDLAATYEIGDTVTLDYVPGSSPIRDLSLTAAAPFTDVEVLAEAFGSLEPLVVVVDGYHGADRVVVVLTEPISAPSVPLPAQWTVTVGGATVPVAAVSDLYPDIGLAFVELTLGSAVSAGQTVYVDYTAEPGRSVSRFSGSELASFGWDAAVLFGDSASGTLAPGESLSTTGGDTVEDPVGVTVVSSQGGSASIEERLVEGTSPSGYAFFGNELDITMADAASAADPNVISFFLDAAIIPAGQSASTIAIFRNGVVVPPCAGAPGTADPSPCVSARETGPEGDVTITVLSIQASIWNFGVVLPYAFGGFQQPVDAQARNIMRAGRAVPVKFTLGGDRGMNIFASESPSSRWIACDASEEGDELEETVTAGRSSLSYDPSADRYTYVWKTDPAWEGTCRRLTLMFADGSQASALFDFSR